MTKTDLLKRIEEMDEDKVFVIVDGNGGWCNIEKVVEKQCQIELHMELDPVFSES